MDVGVSQIIPNEVNFFTVIPKNKVINSCSSNAGNDDTQLTQFLKQVVVSCQLLGSAPTLYNKHLIDNSLFI